MNSHVEISKRLVLINSSFTIATRLIGVSVLVWMHQYLLQRIAPSEYAIYAVVGSIIVFAPILFSIVTGGIARYIVEAYAKGDTWRVTQIVSSMLPLLLLTAGAFALLGCTAAWFIGDIITVDPQQITDARIMMVLLVLINATELIILPFILGLYVRQKFIWLNLIELGQELIRVTLVFALLVGVSPRVIWVVVAMVASRTVGLFATLVVSQRLVPALRFKWRAHDWSVARTLTSFGAWTVLGGVAYRIRTNADAIILNEMSTPVAVSSFHVGALPDRQIETVTTLATTPLQPPITAMHAIGDTEALKRAYLRGNRYHLWLVMLPAVPLMAFGVPLARLYVGDVYASAGVVMLLLSATYAFQYSSAMLYHVALAVARVKGFLLASIGAQLANVALTLYLVGALELGAAGAALGTFITAVLANILLFWPLGLALVDIAFGRFVRETIVPGLLPASAALCACSALGAIKQPDDWWTLGAFAVISGLVYMATLLTVALRPEDRRDLSKAIERIVAFVRGTKHDMTDG